MQAIDEPCCGSRVVRPEGRGPFREARRRPRRRLTTSPAELRRRSLSAVNGADCDGATPASPIRQIEFRLVQLIFVWFSNNRRLAVVIVAAVFLILFILVIVGVPRRHRGVDEAPPGEDAFRRASGHVRLPQMVTHVHGPSLTRGRPDDLGRLSIGEGRGGQHLVLRLRRPLGSDLRSGQTGLGAASGPALLSDRGVTV